MIKLNNFSFYILRNFTYFVLYIFYLSINKMIIIKYLILIYIYSNKHIIFSIIR